MPERKPTKMINKTELKSKSRPTTCLKEPPSSAGNLDRKIDTKG
ncbi:unnamed protein product [Brassica oleracea var. botrytis]